MLRKALLILSIAYVSFMYEIKTSYSLTFYKDPYYLNALIGHAADIDFPDPKCDPSSMNSKQMQLFDNFKKKLNRKVIGLDQCPIAADVYKITKDISDFEMANVMYHVDTTWFMHDFPPDVMAWQVKAYQEYPKGSMERMLSGLRAGDLLRSTRMFAEAELWFTALLQEEDFKNSRFCRLYINDELERIQNHDYYLFGIERSELPPDDVTWKPEELGYKLALP